MIFLPLSQGRFALIDDEDSDLLGFKWFAQKRSRTFYSLRNVRRSDGTWTTRKLHRDVAARMGIAGDVDHRNRHGLDCTRGNLRAATRQQNAANRGLQSNNTSGVKGVYLDRRNGKWCAQVKVNQKNNYLGSFADKAEAAAAARAASERAFGDFVCHG